MGLLPPSMHDSSYVEFALNLAGTNIAITLLDKAREGAPLCSHFFRDVLHQGHPEAARVKVIAPEKGNNGFPLNAGDQEQVFEQLLPPKKVAEWLRDTLKHTGDFPIHEKTVCSFCLGGLLLFDPETARGQIYLLRQDQRRFQPLHRIFWMYFAQVLGEHHRCFVHCAALAKDREGALFFGDSGVGKSTLADNCNGCLVFCDDSPVFSRHNGEYYMFPSPYHQLDLSGGLKKEVIGKSARVKALYFLTRDERVHLDRISRKRAISMIINRFIHFFPYLSPDAKSALFDLFIEVCHTLPAYHFHIGRSQDVPGVITDR